jgi:hypothetical protein
MVNQTERNRPPMTQTATLAVAADYADAMLVARRAKNVLFLFLLLFLLLRIAMFLVARFVPSVHLTATIQTAAANAATTQISLVQSTPAEPTEGQRMAAPYARWLIDITEFWGLLFAVVLPAVLLLIVGIMLVGRLVGVTHVTSAFIWSFALLVMLIPWQSVLNSEIRSIHLLHDWRGHSAGEVIATDSSAASALVDAGIAENTARTLSTTMPDVRIPGVLYTWPELARDYDFANADTKLATLKWARYIGFPVLAIIMLLVIQARSSRGLRYALGESEMQIPITGAGQ